MQDARAQVVVRNLSKAFGRVQAVSGVGFEIHAGEVLGLLGPNGAGKTATLESATGLVRPDEGSITICGIDARRRPREARQRIGVTLQSTGLQDKITPREALCVYGSLYRAARDPQALLDRFGLQDKAHAAFETLSGGQKQRLALALAFLNDPQVLFLDEPTAGLDPPSRRGLHDEIRQMKREGRSVLLTTHDMAEAGELCDRVAILHGGRIVAQGSPQQLIAGSHEAAKLSIQTASPVEPAWLEGLPLACGVVCDEQSVQLTTADVNQTLTELLTLLNARHIRILEVHTVRQTLEDVILRIASTPAQP